MKDVLEGIIFCVESDGFAFVYYEDGRYLEEDLRSGEVRYRGFWKVVDGAVRVASHSDSSSFFDCLPQVQSEYNKWLARKITE